MANLERTTSVTAHADQVWATVADFEGYPRWHPLVHWIKVSTDWSTKIAARIRLTRRTVRLRGSLLEHDPSNVISWEGSHWIWGLIRARYTLRVARTATGSDVIQSVKVTGWLPRLMPRVVRSLPDALAETAHALKSEIERESTVPAAA